MPPDSPTPPAPAPFSITRARLPEAGTPIVAVAGELDLYTAPEFRDALLAVAEGEDVIVDLRDSSFIDSTGCRALLMAARRLEQRGGRLVIVNTDPEIARIFSVMGFDELFPILATPEEARELVESGEPAPELPPPAPGEGLP